MTYATVLLAPKTDDNCLSRVVDPLRERGVAIEEREHHEIEISTDYCGNGANTKRTRGLT